MSRADSLDQLDAIAIIGMACRFPGAENVDAFWHNLRDGVESIMFFSDEELLAAGVDPVVVNDPRYVKAKPVLKDVELFDAAFFNINPKEAEVMDPQHRLFLECAWEVLENAGYDSQRFQGRIGVYAGAELSSYLLNNLVTNRELGSALSGLQVVTGVDRGYLSTRISYELNLTGPSLTVQTSCSTSLVALHLACESLLNSECDMALAGGVTVSVPQKAGYWYREGGIASPDGHCRAFDARAQGTIFGSGVGVVVLKRLEDALADGDQIHAVIRGSAINNDGAFKIGYTAPSVDGQAAVINEALSVAEVDPATITYVEAHGTGTEMGDPIEITALTQAFRLSTEKMGFCAIGSVKSNVGHLAVAAGMAGLIKTVLALKHKQIPPSLFFEQPNPKINFEDSPFVVNAALREWRADGVPCRAGVSSFGMGGTNAHVVLEEAPPVEKGGDSRPWHLLPLSAKTESALEQATGDLAAHLKAHPELDLLGRASGRSLADVSYTLQVGRRAFEYRRIVACRDVADAVAALEMRDPKRVFTGYQEDGVRTVAFMFPGLGDQYPNMARGLYEAEPVFRGQVDRCCELLRPHLGRDLREVLFPDDGLEDSSAAAAPAMDFRRMLGRGDAEPADAATQRLNQTSIAHPALFVIEYALAQLLMAWGVQPRAVIGHSIGEYVAACLAGVLSLADALALVARRAQMIEALPGGAMLGVPLSEQEVQPLLGEDLSLSAINGPRVCVLAGPEAAIAELERSLLAQDVACRRVLSSHAFHSHMLDPIVAPLTELVKTFDLKPPRIPYISNLTGTWITDEQATDAGYWGRHSRHPVRFADGIGELWQEPDGVLLEVGPGHTLSTMALQHPAGGEALERVLSTVRHAYEPQADLKVLLNAVGQLWMLGVPVDWEAFHGGARRLRVPLPTYPFERQRYWIEPGKGVTSGPDPLARRADVTDWFYLPSWKRTVPPLREAREVTGRWLVFDDGGSLSASLVRQLVGQGGRVVVVRASERFATEGDGYTLDPARCEDYEALLAALDERGQVPDQIVHLWNIAPPDEKDPLEKALLRGFYSLLFLAQALDGRRMDVSLCLTVVASNLYKVASGEIVYPEKATLVGPCKIIPQELPGLTCRTVDVALPQAGSRQEAQLVEHLIAEVEAGTPDATVAYRGYDRWVQTYEPAPLPAAGATTASLLREGGVYLITDGLQGVGLELARYLAQKAKARLVLTTHADLPGLETLESVGADEVLVVQADVTNQEQVEDAVRTACQQFGAIHGVFHTAGVRGAGPIRAHTLASAASALGPQVHGTRVLAAALGDLTPDFVVLCSSLAALTGGVGQVVSCAAGAFMDAFAQARQAQDGALTLSVNWDTWDASEREQMLEALGRILARNRLPQIAVCSRHLPALVAQSSAFVDALAPAQDAEDGRGGAGVEHSRPNLPTTYAAPQDDVEKKLAGIWQQVLGIGEVGRNDSFFRLGGHSLVAIQLINRVRDTFEVEMDLRASFEAPTIAELAERIQQAQQSAREMPVPPLAPLAREGALPLSYAQQQWWLLDRARHDGREPERSGGLRRLLAPLRRARAPKEEVQTSDDRVLNLVATLRLDGQLDAATLERCLAEVVRRHEILRTTFATVNGEPVPVFASSATAELLTLDLSDRPEVEREMRWQQLVAEEAQRAFDLAHGPPWRAALVKLGSEAHALLLNLHRIVADERSVELFVQELALCYEAFCAGNSATLPELPLQYADYAAWQRAWLQRSILEQQLAYWRQQLEGSVPALSLPAEWPQTTASGLSRARHPFALSPALSEGLKALSQEQGGTLFMTLLAAFKSLLHGYAGQTDVVVGAPVVNRQRSEIEGLIGPFGNTLALRTDLGGDPTFNELLGRVREVTLGAYAHQDLPYETLLLELERPFLYQVLFVLQNEPLQTLALPELTLSALEIDDQGSGAALTLALQDAPGGLRGALVYNAASFDRETIARLAERYRALLEQVVADPERRLGDLAEAERVL